MTSTTGSRYDDADSARNVLDRVRGQARSRRVQRRHHPAIRAGLDAVGVLPGAPVRDQIEFWLDQSAAYERVGLYAFVADWDNLIERLNVPTPRD